MCSGCKMDDKEMSRQYERQGAVEVDDFYKEVNYRPKKKAKKSKRYPGCPGNDRKAHVYVWTTEKNRPTLFFDYYGFHKYESRICAGCGHYDKRRVTAEYNLRNQKFYDRYATKMRAEGRYVARIRWFRFEDYDEGYREKRNRILTRGAYNWDYVYSGRLWG